MSSIEYVYVVPIFSTSGILMKSIDKWNMTIVEGQLPKQSVYKYLPGSIPPWNIYALVILNLSYRFHNGLRVVNKPQLEIQGDHHENSEGSPKYALAHRYRDGSG